MLKRFYRVLDQIDPNPSHVHTEIIVPVDSRDVAGEVLVILRGHAVQHPLVSVVLERPFLHGKII